MKSPKNMDLDYVAIGRKVSDLRREHGLSQVELSEKIEVSTQHISNIENGRTRLSLSCLVRIARCFDVPITYFLSEEDRTPEEQCEIIENLMSSCSPELLHDLGEALYLLHPLMKAPEREGRHKKE